ncbi:MAG TPA: hypothetical protein VHE14_05895 [Solirubrobacteraceae bacterium]|nr:hypothetical protein [Solirubrobacteraceae bacterium]
MGRFELGGSRFAVALLAVVGVLVCVPAAADARGGCASPGKTVVKSTSSRVFKRGKFHTDLGENEPLFYACIKGAERITRLNPKGEFGLDPLTRAVKIRLAGPYVAFGVSSIGAQAVVSEVDVIDLRTGKMARSEQATELGEASKVVLTPRGTVAFTFYECVVDPNTHVCATPIQRIFQVALADRRGRSGARALATGADIEPTSLSLSGNTKSISWKQGGATHHSPIR